MFIENDFYKTDLTSTNSIRYALFTNLYSDPSCIQNLCDIISKYIDNLGIDFDPSNYMITVKIKKTSIRKMYGTKFIHRPEFYYQFIPMIFGEFFNNHKDKIIAILSANYPNPYDIFNKFISDSNVSMPTMCHITCLFDNVITIKL